MRWVLAKKYNMCPTTRRALMFLIVAHVVPIFNGCNDPHGSGTNRGKNQLSTVGRTKVRCIWKAVWRILLWLNEEKNSGTAKRRIYAYQNLAIRHPWLQFSYNLLVPIHNVCESSLLMREFTMDVCLNSIEICHTEKQA